MIEDPTEHVPVLVLVFMVSTVAWVALAKRSFHYLLPVYVVTAILPSPVADLLIIYPDLGLGRLVRPFPQVGDVLLVATMVFSKVARAGLRNRASAALVVVSMISIATGLLVSEHPVPVLVYLGVSPLRIALMIALLRAAGPGETKQRAVGLLITLSMFVVPAAAFILTTVAPDLMPLAEAAGLMAGNRPGFPTLGNNKIGVCLLLLGAALFVSRNQWGHHFRDNGRLVLTWALVAATVTAAFSSLRFATTALLIVLLTHVLHESRLLAAFGMFAGAVGLSWLVLVGSGGTAPARAFGVLSGTFELADDPSANSRLGLWVSALSIWRTQPLVGRLGGWEYEREVSRFVYLQPIETHSEFLWQLASFGLLGTVVTVVILWVTLRRAWKINKVGFTATLVAALSLTLNTVSFFPAAAVILAALIVAAESAASETPTGDSVPTAR